MNAEFHYYTIFALAIEAGMTESDASIVAGSSQYIDNASIPLMVETPRERIPLIVTQNYLFWNEEVRKNIYLPFHFIPGNIEKRDERRLDGSANRYNVVPNGKLAKEALIQALQGKNLYRIGIALHGFADTWAHQNFSGLVEDWNDLGQRGLSMSLPPAGHLHAFTNPDQPNKIWNDPRLVTEASCIDNTARFVEAARKIYRYLRLFMKTPYDDEELILDKLKTVWSSPSTDERLADYVITWQMPVWTAGSWREEAGIRAHESLFSGIQGYDKLAWLKSQVSDSLSGGSTAEVVRTGMDFYESSLYRFHTAALEHRAYMQKLFSTEGISL